MMLQAKMAGGRVATRAEREADLEERQAAHMEAVGAKKEAARLAEEAKRPFPFAFPQDAGYAQIPQNALALALAANVEHGAGRASDAFGVVATRMEKNVVRVSFPTGRTETVLVPEFFNLPRDATSFEGR